MGKKKKKQLMTWRVVHIKLIIQVKGRRNANNKRGSADIYNCAGQERYPIVNKITKSFKYSSEVENSSAYNQINIFSLFHNDFWYYSQ